jgi:hypothetical protein
MKQPYRRSARRVAAAVYHWLSGSVRKQCQQLNSISLASVFFWPPSRISTTTISLIWRRILTPRDKFSRRHDMAGWGLATTAILFCVFLSFTTTHGALTVHTLHKCAAHHRRQSGIHRLGSCPGELLNNIYNYNSETKTGHTFTRSTV